MCCGHSPAGRHCRLRGANRSGQALALEQRYFDQFPGVTAQLEAAGSRASRRLLSVLPGDLGWAWQEDTLTIYFSLQTGSYATIVLREVLNVGNHVPDRATSQHNGTGDS